MIEFFVPGLAAPGGSKKAFVVAGKARLTDDCIRNAPWRSVVALAAERAMEGNPPFDGPLLLTVTFTLPRPKGHYRTGKHAGELRRCAPLWPTGRPDTTKLLRALEDALKNICWKDDAQVVGQTVRKRYGSPPGARVAIACAYSGEEG